MPLVHTCDCGHRLRLKEEHVGKRLKCPRCSESFTVSDKPAADKAAPRCSAAADEDDDGASAPEEGKDEQQPKRRRKRKKVKKRWFRLPEIHVSFLGLSGWAWVVIFVIMLTLLGGGLAVYHAVPGWGSRMCYSIEPFGQEAPPGLLGEMSKGITVKIHNTPAGTIEHKLVTARTVAGLKTAKYDRRTSLAVRDTAKGPSGEVAYEIDWTFDRGIVSVKCDGHLVPAAIWEHETGQHQ
jgi:hypothetical protein